MSWNLYLVTEDADGNEIWDDIICGMTYNLTPMWREAVPFMDVTRDFDGKKCEDILLDLQIGLADVTLNPDKYRAMNPTNGWGDYEGFLRVITDTFTICRRHPSGVLSWSG